jgi:hypothetical protein
MKSLSSNAFLEYAKVRKVILLHNNKEEILENIKEDDVIEQLYILGDFHKRVMGYDNYIGHRLEDKRGRMVEQYKVYIKKVKREYSVIKDKVIHNNFEELVLKYGEEYINRAQESIDIIYKNSYLELIKRSMNRIEVCLGNAYYTDLKRKEYIEASNLNNCFYDLVEIDAVYFFNKLLKSGAKLNYRSLIKKFCEIEGLDERSERVIEALVAYPQEFMKCCSKYSRSYGNVDVEKYTSKLKKIIDNDSFSLLQGEVGSC